uniref:Afadin n=1 Tax=Mesocestoides corti TaxID=53468 RepID=A0A5K3EQF8_MESCO
MISKMEDVRRDLLRLIEEWNASRLDLFHLSTPNEFLEFRGVMRFFFQDDDLKFQTKCLRVSSSTKTCELIPMLCEKFCLLTLHLNPGNLGLYEHFSNSERILGSDEYPLLVQLNWSKIGQDGKFILKPIHSTIVPKKPEDKSQTKTNQPLKKNDKKSSKKLKSNGALDTWFCGRATDRKENGDRSSGCGPRIWRHEQHDEDKWPEVDSHSKSRCDSPPNSTFTRMIPDPETAMQKKRQQVLGEKLSQIVSNGSDYMGGTLKIYGDLIDPNVPYKTLLLSIEDSVSHVIRQALDKYGLELADPAAYCLVMRTRSANEAPMKETREEVLKNDSCPLKLLLCPDSSHEGIITTFELRPRLTRMGKQRSIERNGRGLSPPPLIRLPYHQINPKTSHPSETSRVQPANGRQNSFACLVDVCAEEQHFVKPAFYPLPLHLGQVCVGTSLQPSTKFPLLVTLPLNVYPDVAPFHLVVWQPRVTSGQSSPRCSSRSWLACAPVANTPVFVNGHRLNLSGFRPYSLDRRRQFTHQTSSLAQESAVHWLTPGDVIQLGSGERCRFRIWPGRSPPPLPNIPSLASTSRFRVNGINKLVVPTYTSNCHQHQSGRLKVQANQQYHRHRQHHQQKHRPISIDSTKSDLSDNSCSMALSPTSSVMEQESGAIFSDAVMTPRESFTSSGSFRSPIIVASTKYTDSRMQANHLQVKHVTSSATSPTLSTSGIGTCTKQTDSRSGHTLSVRKSPNHSQLSDSGSHAAAPPLLDRLPCQLAYAPTSLDALLDWLLVSPFRIQKGEAEGPEPLTCSLGPAFSVYLMLRAICRQCDRWEAIENRKMAAESSSDLKIKQHSRRQRELLTLFVAVVDRLVSVERHLSEEISVDSNSHNDLEERAKLSSIILSNLSQLLHFVSKDIDLQRIFQPGEEGEGAGECANAWLALTDRVAELVESVFNSLLATCTALLSFKQCLPALVASWDLRAATCRDNESTGEVNEGGEEREEEIEITDDTSIDELVDPVLDELTKVLDFLNTNSVNPAFLVQLFARLLHYIGARLFNCLVEEPRRVSPQWGHLLFEWIHKKLVSWAEPQGLRVAVECYLTRLSQAADLMQASTETVEGLYNSAVDLDRLNSVQVRFLLEAYRPSYAKPVVNVSLEAQAGEEAGKSEHILPQWIDFIISGVSQVSDRLLAEESEQPDWRPHLREPLELQLPLLLPDDCYPSSIPIRNPHLEVNQETPDSGQSGALEVSHLAAYLRPALANGWCRLSVRQVPSMENETWLSWTVYLSEEIPTPVHLSRPLSEREKQMDSPGPRTPPAFEAPSPPNKEKSLNVPTDPPPSSTFMSDRSLEFPKLEEGRNVKIFDVAVPKVGNNLGLRIVAARSEDGSDLGIYVKSVTPGGGASQAHLLNRGTSREDELAPHPPIAPGDRILAVDGKQTQGLSQDAAARLVLLAGHEVHLTLARNLGLGCVAAAVPARDLRKRNGQAQNRRHTTTPQSADLQKAAMKVTSCAQPPKDSPIVVRASSNTNGRHSVEHVDIQSGGVASASLPSPRILVETSSLLAHEVTTVSGIQRSRSLMSADVRDRRFSVERGSYDIAETPLSSQPNAVSHAPELSRLSIMDGKDADRILRPINAHQYKGVQPADWKEMDVDETLEMLKEMRDQLDRSLALRGQHTTSFHAPPPPSVISADRKSQYSGDVSRDPAETTRYRPYPVDYSMGPRDKAMWSEESSAFRTTPDLTNAVTLVRSASTYTPARYQTSSASMDDRHRTHLVFRSPMATFNGGSRVNRSNTSDQIRCPGNAIQPAHEPSKHVVAAVTRLPNLGQATPSRPHDPDVTHRRSQSADQTPEGTVDAGGQPSVAERVKLFQTVIESHCK